MNSLIITSMDSQTDCYYNENVLELIKKYDSAKGGVCKYFKIAFKVGYKILDIGCGSGRDLKILHALGYKADGVDSCSQFVRHINENKNSIASVVKKDELPSLTTIDDSQYSGILCSAVIMHLSNKHLLEAATTIRRIMRQKGSLLISIPLDDLEIDQTTRRDPSGRLFNKVTPEQLKEIFKHEGFSLSECWEDEDSLNRKYRRWSTLLFKL